MLIVGNSNTGKTRILLLRDCIFFSLKGYPRRLGLGDKRSWLA